VSYQWCQSFIEELKHWDGSYKSNTIGYSSAIKSCVEKAQEIGVLAGYKTQVSSYLDPRGDRQLMHYITYTTTKSRVGGDSVSKRVVQYTGKVYCVSVPSKMLVVRRNGVVAVSGNSEHSVMCAGGKDDELETYRRLIQDVYPSGIVSIVSDTWDFWKVMTETSKTLKDTILMRLPNGLGLAKVVFRPDSGDPVKILVGNPEAEPGSPEFKGAVECLWEIFGGTTTDKGYKVLHERVGLIYGDSITLDRADRIMSGLMEKGFASCNTVLGIGSYTYQYLTRDTLGWAVKATGCQINGEMIEMFKDPITDSGTKKSAKGFLKVIKEDSEYKLLDQQKVTLDELMYDQEGDELKVVFYNGKAYNLQTLSEIRARLAAAL
jgi:nicotinamide phosphoribosyltransferase